MTAQLIILLVTSHQFCKEHTIKSLLIIIWQLAMFLIFALVASRMLSYSQCFTLSIPNLHPSVDTKDKFYTCNSGQNRFSDVGFYRVPAGNAVLYSPLSPWTFQGIEYRAGWIRDRHADLHFWKQSISNFPPAQNIQLSIRVNKTR
jgi:hypothetical protein